MKNIKLLMLFVFAATLFSCDDDRNIQQLTENGLVPTVTSTVDTDYTFVEADIDKSWVDFAWDKADFGANVIVEYTIEIDAEAGTYEAPITFDAKTATKLTLKVSDINGKLNNKKYVAGIAKAFKGRIKASVKGTSDVNPLYSSEFTFNATPYKVVIVYPKIYVPGSHQGWSPENAPNLYSVKDDKKYSGYINLPDASNEFKFTPNPNWDTDWGFASEGKLKVKGDNIKVDGAGYYYIVADVNKLTYSTELREWAIIGDATPNAWASGTKMTFNTTTNKLEITTNLIVGEFKFRAENLVDPWSENLGDTGADGSMEAGGDNVKITTAGSYLITLDLTTPEYKYSVTLK